LVSAGSNLLSSYVCGAADRPLLGKCVGQVLDEAAEKHPDQDGLIVRHENRRFTYRQLQKEVELAARGFLALGIQKGDRVGIWSTNSSEWVITQFATARMGAILVNINPAYRAYELEYALRQSECQTLLLIQGFRDCDYVSTLASVCPEFGHSQPGALHSEKLPHLKNLIFIGDVAPVGMLPAIRDHRCRRDEVDCDRAVRIVDGDFGARGWRSSRVKRGIR